MSTFEIREVKARSEFDAVINVQWAAFEDPFRPHFAWMHPVIGFTEEDRIASIKADTDRRWQAHQSEPASHWLYVINTADGQVVGSAQWQVHTTNPYPNGPVPLKCTWFPEGETREFVTSFINQCYYARMNWMDRPHLGLSAMAVIPSMRGRGVGSMLMRWGLEQAERRDLECFTEASDPGRDLCAHFGFRTIMAFACNMHVREPTPTWIRLQHQYPVAVATLMWRPAPGDLRGGKEVSFWDKVKRIGLDAKDGE